MNLQCLRKFTLLLTPDSYALSLKYDFDDYSVDATISVIEFRKVPSDISHDIAPQPTYGGYGPTLLRNLVECRYIVGRAKNTWTHTLGYEGTEPMNIDLTQIQQREQTLWTFILKDLFARLPDRGVVRIECSMGEWCNLRLDKIR